MTASRVMDAISLLPGCSGQQSDAPQAYTQCKLGTGMEEDTQETWVELPEEYWPDGWKGKYRRPVVRLVLSLYGHPLSGKFWGNYYGEHRDDWSTYLGNS